MPKPVNYALLTEQLRTLFLTRGELKAPEACEALGVSQATFSRLVERMGQSLVVFGKARHTRYALRRTVHLLGESLPLYTISEEGRPIPLTKLNLVTPKGVFIEPHENLLQEALYPDLPYFLDDIRPAGFLGRLVPHAHPELGAPQDILNWSADDCLRYWSFWGWNLIGNLVVGERAFQKFLEHRQKRLPGGSHPTVSPKDFPSRAHAVLSQGEAGSSAGGEQPKFLLEAEAENPAALVKFSPPLQDPIARRVGDLLVCEHLCLELLSERKITAAKTRIHVVENQVFLWVQRFDRVGLHGRKGVISLRALNLEFVGAQERWSIIGQGLRKIGKIQPDDQTLIREMEIFGQLIGNTDMHAGNFSFQLGEGFEIGPPAPIYDMLPMMYYPRQNQLVDKAYVPQLPLPEDSELWKKAASMALEFWERAGRDKRISEDFREAALRNWKVLQTQIQAALQIF